MSNEKNIFVEYVTELCKVNKKILYLLSLKFIFLFNSINNFISI